MHPTGAGPPSLAALLGGRSHGLAGPGTGEHGGVMMESSGISVSVETQTFRFIPSSPISHQEAVSLAGGSASGSYVVISHEEPRATFVVEPDGSVLVHGIARAEVARIAVQELLLTMGMSDDNIGMESGEMLIRFTIGRAVMLPLAAERFEAIEMDTRLGALRIDATMHNSQIIIFNNGHGVVLGQNSKKIAEMAVRHWTKLLDEEGALA